jgi:hypothetical protein
MQPLLSNAGPSFLQLRAGGVSYVCCVVGKGSWRLSKGPLAYNTLILPLKMFSVNSRQTLLWSFDHRDLFEGPFPAMKLFGRANVGACSGCTFRKSRRLETPRPLIFRSGCDSHVPYRSCGPLGYGPNSSGSRSRF